MGLLLWNISDDKKYRFKLSSEIVYSKNFNLIATEMPGGKSEETVLTALMGMSGDIDINFKITPRASTDSDSDYTYGTGTPSYNDISAEFKWLYNTVCGDSNKNFKLIDTALDINKFCTVNSLRLSRREDGPNEYEGTINIKIGLLVSSTS